MNLYRFFGHFATFCEWFANDDAAFEEASNMADGPGVIRVQRFRNGYWQEWDAEKEIWY